MKNKRNAIVAFLLVAVLCLGIGYAAVSDNLYINGTLNVTAGDPTDPTSPFNTEFDADVFFSNAEIDTTTTANKGTEGNELITATIGDEDENEATRGQDDVITVNVSNGAFDGQNEIIVIKATVKNANETQSAKVTVAGPQNLNDHFTVTIDKTTEQTIAAEGECVYTITIELVKIPADDIKNAEFTITFTAVPGELTTGA